MPITRSTGSSSGGYCSLVVDRRPMAFLFERAKAMASSHMCCSAGVIRRFLSDHSRARYLEVSLGCAHVISVYSGY